MECDCKMCEEYRYRAATTKPHPVEKCTCEECVKVMERLKAKGLDWMIQGDPRETKKPRTWQLWLILVVCSIAGFSSVWLLSRVFGTLTASVR